MSYLSRSIYPAVSGSQSDFGVTFPYLLKAHVHVYSRNAATGVLTEYLNGFSWSSSSLIHISTPPPAGVTIEIWRKTPKGELLDRIGAASVFTSKKVNGMSTQLLYITQETEDETTELSTRAILAPINEVAPAFPSLTGAIGKMLVAVSSTVIAWLTPSEAGIAKGDPGGNVLSIGTFTTANTLTIGVGTDLVQTSGYSASGKGAALYVYDVAVDAAFVTAHPTWSFRSVNGRGFRLYQQQVVWFEMFGAAGDASASGAGTDDYPAWLGAKDFIHFHRFSPLASYYKPSIAIHLRQVRYYSSLAWDLTDACYEILGSGSNLQGYSGTTIFFAAGQCGIICQSWDTAGVTGSKTNDGIVTGANGTHLRDISVISKGGTLEAQQHGILVKCTVVLERVHAFDFGGDGIRIIASTPSSGNANGAILYNCGATRSGMCGLYIQGADVNSIKNLSFQAYNNRMFGLNDSSFLGNTHLGYEPGGNALQGQGPSWGTGYAGTSVHYAGNLYRVRPGAHVAASTTTPGTNSAVWSPVGAGGASALYPTWVSGAAYSSGGSVYCGGFGYSQNNNNMSTFQGYFEQDQMPPWSDSSEASSLPGLLQIGPGLYCVNGTMVSGQMGSRVSHSDGTVITNILGGNAENDGQYARIGRGSLEQTPWTFHIDVNNRLTLKMNGSDGWHPYYIHPQGAVIGMGFPIGIGIQNSLQYSAAVIPASGAHTRGMIVWNETPSAGGKVGWVCTADGTPGTWKPFGAIDA